MNATQIAATKESCAKDLNIDDRISKFQTILRNEQVYRFTVFH